MVAQPQHNQTQTNKSQKQSSTNNSPAYRENIFVTAAMAPIRSTNACFSYLSGYWGFRKVLAPVASFYCLALGVEATFLTFPTVADRLDLSIPDLVREDYRFVPKVGISDGAELSRLLPLKQVGNLVGNHTPLPHWMVRGMVTQQHNVWDFWALFLFAFAVSAGIQFYERQIQNPKAIQDVRADFHRANNTKRVKADPDAIWLAKKLEMQHNAHGTGSTAIDLLSVGLIYGIEIAAFAASFGMNNASPFVTTLYCLMTVFGFEAFDRYRAEGER